MNWSFAAIFLALLFTTACSQRGGRRYLPDQPLEENLAVDNHRFQTRSRGDGEDARRGEGRRARIQETTETNSHLTRGRSQINTAEPRQFRSRFGKEEESKTAGNRQFASRRSLETDPSRQTSHEGTQNERFRSRESSAITENASKVKNSRGRARVESTTVEYRSRGTEGKRFPGRGSQEQESSRSGKELDHFYVVEKPESRHRSQTTRKNTIEPPKPSEPVTEGFISRHPLREEIQRSGVQETTEKLTRIYHSIPITEGKVPDLTSASNEIETEKRTRPLDSTVTEKSHHRREGIRQSRVDPSTEKTYYIKRNGRKKTEEPQMRGSTLESRRRGRPTYASVTERFHSRQLSRDDNPPKRSRVNQSTEKIRSDIGNAGRGRKSHEFTSRGVGGTEFEKRRPAESSSTERFHSRELDRDKSQSIIEPSTSASIETGVSPELSNKEINTVEAENKVPTESAVSEQTPEANIEAVKPITSQPDPLSTENTVDFPIKSNDVEEPNRTSRKLESDIPERSNQNHQRGLNHDFENSKRGRLESTLSRERSRSQEPPSRGIEGRRSSRRLITKSPDASRETFTESKGRRTVQRLPSRTRNTDTSNEQRREKLDGERRSIPARHRSESPVARSRNVERISEPALGPEPVTESRIESKVSTESQIQNERKYEVTAAGSAETQIASTQRALARNVSRKPGNRGRSNAKVANVQEEKAHSGEVKDEDNYPEVYKQLKKSGTDPKDILAMLKARKAVREKLDKTNSKISQPDTSLNPSQRPVFGSDEIKTPLLRGTTVTNSNFRSRDHRSEEINQRIESNIDTNEEQSNSVGSTEKSERFSNFRSSRFKTPKTFNQKSDSPTTVKTTNELVTEEKPLQDETPVDKKYNPYNYQEIRSFNRKKNLPERNKNYRNTVKSFKNSDEQKPEEKNSNIEYQSTENQDPVKEKIKKSFTGQRSTRFRSTLKDNNVPSLKKEGIISHNDNIDEIRNEKTRGFTRPGISKFRSISKSNSHETKHNEEEALNQNDELSDATEEKHLEKESKLYREEENESNSYSTQVKETSDRGRKFELTAPDNNSSRKKINNRPEEEPESESIKPRRRPSFSNAPISKFKSRKEINDTEPSTEASAEKTSKRSNYIPRNRDSYLKKFKARTEKTLEDVSVEPSITRNYNFFNRNEHSFRRRSFTSPASEGTEILTTVQYKNSMVAPRTRPPFIPQRKKFVKSTTFDPIPISRFKARKASLSKLFNEEVLKVDNSEDHTLTFNFKEEDDLRPNINDLSIDSLVSESEHSSFTTETTTISSAQKRPRYTESHIQRVPPKRRGSEYYMTATSSTTSKPEVYTVLAVPYYDESNPVSETTMSTEFFMDPTTQSVTLSDIIPTTTPISTTDFASTYFSTPETPSTSTVTTTETPQSSTSSLFTLESTTIKTTTNEPTTISTTTDSVMTKSTTESLMTSTVTESITTFPTTSTQIPTTTITTTTTTTTKRPTTTKQPTTTKTTTKRPTTTKQPTTTKTTTKRPTTTSTTKRPTTTTKRPTTTTKRPTTSTTTTKRPTTITSSTTKPTNRKTTVSSTTIPTTKKTTPKPTTTTLPPSISVTTISTPLSSTQKAAHLTTTFKIDELLSTTHPNFLSTIAYLARNLTVAPTSFENANTANFKTPSIPIENTTPMENQSAKKNDYFVYGLLPNNNVVRKVVKTTASPMDVPFYIYGLYPNGTIVRRFPNGTIVPDETEEENEVIGKIEPGSEESLETVVKKDNPLSYLYPLGHEKTTQTAQVPNIPTTTTTKQPELSSEVIPLDPRIASMSSLEKPAISIKDTSSNSEPTTVKSTTKLTTPKPLTTTTTKSTTKLTTAKPQIKTTTKSTTKLTTTKPRIKSTTTKLTTAKPPTRSTTIKSTTKLTTAKPTTKSTTTKFTTVKPTTKAPVTKAANIKQTTAKPTTKITSTKPKPTPTTKPTPKPTSAKPIAKTTTPKPTPKSTLRPTTTKPRPKATTAKSTPKATTTKSTPKATTRKSTPKTTTTKPTSKFTTAATIKPTSTAMPKTKATTKMPITTTNKSTTSTKSPPKAPTTKSNRKSQEKSTIKTITTPLSDADLLNNLLSQDVKAIIPKGTTESSVALADKVLQLAIERAQKSSTAPPVLNPEDLQSLSSTLNPVQKQSLGGKSTGKSKKLNDETNTNKTGKISVWVIPPDESTTSKPSVGVSKSEAELLNALLSSPNTIENLSLSDQLLLADLISSTAVPQTTRKKKKKSRTTTTTTTPAPPAFPILQYLFGRNRGGSGGGGGLFQRGLFRGGGLRNLESGTTPAASSDGGIFQNDGLPQGQGELAAESQDDPQQGEGGPGLVSAAINVSRAVSQFMGFVIQGAAQSFQNYLQTRTRALANALTYPPAS